MSKAQIFQIFYDEKSKSQIHDGFKGLDNASAQVDGWYEFSPIFNFLESNSAFILEDFQFKIYSIISHKKLIDILFKILKSPSI